MKSNNSLEFVFGVLHKQALLMSRLYSTCIDLCFSSSFYWFFFSHLLLYPNWNPLTVKLFSIFTNRKILTGIWRIPSPWAGEPSITRNYSSDCFYGYQFCSSMYYLMDLSFFFILNASLAFIVAVLWKPGNIQEEVK